MENKIKDLLNNYRCRTCTEFDNVNLVQAIDNAKFRPCPETLAQLEKAIEADKTENPSAWRSGSCA